MQGPFVVATLLRQPDGSREFGVGISDEPDGHPLFTMTSADFIAWVGQGVTLANSQISRRIEMAAALKQETAA